jgi:ribosomal protein S18 acetylase RimI-like enzyme
VTPPAVASDGIAIRRLGAGDAAAFRSMRLAALLDSPTAFGSSHHEEAHQPLEWFARRLESDDGMMFGAFAAGLLVGMVGVVREPAAKERHRAAIRSMFVSPSARGRGVASALLGHALAAADALPGVWQVILTVTAGNAAALGLYRAHGFTQYGVLPSSLYVGGRYYDDVLMIRQRTPDADGRTGPGATMDAGAPDVD